MTEEWRQVPGYEGAYMASDLGRVRSTKKLLTPTRRKSGHRVVRLKDKLMLVHRVVLLAFVGACPAGLMTLHLNHTPDDNRLINLRYGTRSENLKMDFLAGTRSHRGERAPNAKLTYLEVCAIRSSPLPTKALAEIYGVTQRNVRSVISQETWKHVPHDAGPSLAGNKTPTGETTMATRAPSKIMSVVEKKAAQASLKTALAAHNVSVKSISTALKEADKTLAAANKQAELDAKAAATALAAVKKEADKQVAAAFKAADAATKAINATLAAATKAHAVAVAKAAKAEAAASKGTEKLTNQLAELEAKPTTAVAKATPAKAKEKTRETEAA